MPRTPRLEIANGLYHVTNRGLERRNIVQDNRDRDTWLRLLSRVATRCNWRVFAYVLLAAIVEAANRAKKQAATDAEFRRTLDTLRAQLLS